MSQSTSATVDTADLRSQVQEMYRKVANEPHETYHFEMGRGLAERLGYTADELDRIPAAALESFAGVGYYFDLASLRSGEIVGDLGSGSGTDTFIAANEVGAEGRVIGIDMTDAQLEKANLLRDREGFGNVEFRKGYLEDLPLDDESLDVVISNGVFNLSPEKERVFGEIQRVLRPGGRIAIADIVTDVQLPESITCNASLWAACIGGAAQVDRYIEQIRSAGLTDVEVRENPSYRFLSRSARNASERYGVKSVSVRARKPR
jgi:arsenite methyltransferase